MSSEYIPISEAKAYIQDQLGLPTSKQDNRVVNWIYKAVMDIGVYRLMEAYDEIDINADLQVLKPDCYVGLSRMDLITADGECWGEPTYGKTCLCAKTCTTKGCGDILLEEYEDYFQLSSDATTESIVKVRLFYYIIPMLDSMPAVPYYCSEAIMAYAEWRHLQRTRNKHRAVGNRKNPAPMSEVYKAEERWLTRRLAARTKVRNRLTGQKVRQIAERYIYDYTNIFPPSADAKIKNVYSRYIWQ